MKYTLGKSTIQGVGIFSTETIQPHESIDIAIDFYRDCFPIITEYIGKWVNHSFKNNIYLEYNPDDRKYYFKATELILPDTELLLNYKNTPWYIMKPLPWYK
jgi:hypothetical protein